MARRRTREPGQHFIAGREAADHPTRVTPVHRPALTTAEQRLQARHCSVEELLALARKNDPFYMETPAGLARAEWFDGIWRLSGFSSGVHLRRVHYWCVSQADLRLHDGKPYVNTLGCWGYLLEASKAARYLGLVEIEDIDDHKTPEPRLYATYGTRDPSYRVVPPNLERPTVWVDVPHGAVGQPYHLEVWIEKTSMDDVLDPLCQRYHANLIRGEGEMSIRQAAADCVARIVEADKPARILYISDFDPAGQSMPKAVARKIEWRMRRDGVPHEVKLRPLGLTVAQVRQYRLPRTPIKDTESRGRAFEERYGEGAVELDALEALHPGVLGGLVAAALAPYFDHAAEAEARRLAEALQLAVREQTDAVTARYQPQIGALAAMRAELEAVNGALDPEDYRPPESTLVVEDGEEPWLLDSTRDYLAQIRAYKTYARGGEHP